MITLQLEVLVLGQTLKSVNFQQLGGSPTITITHICNVYIYNILYRLYTSYYIYIYGYIEDAGGFYPFSDHLNLVFHRRQVWLADQVCNGRHYAFVCHLKKLLLI